MSEHKVHISLTRCLVLFTLQPTSPEMTFTTCGHRRIPSLWHLLQRNLSTKSHPAAASQVDVRTTLPAPKIRALISLYHQADSWVTPENLLQKIDEAFVLSSQTALAQVTERVEYMVSVSDMKNHISLMRNAPKMAQWDSSSPGGGEQFSTSEWSDSGKNRRELKVIEALYGVEATAFNHNLKNVSEAFLPGLEVLQESACSAIQDYEDDREAEDLQDLLRSERSV